MIKRVLPTSLRSLACLLFALAFWGCDPAPQEHHAKASPLAGLEAPAKPLPHHMQHNGHFLRWKQPELRIYVNDARYHAMVLRALSPWLQALKPAFPIRTHLTSRADEADIAIRFVPAIDASIQVDARNRRGYTAALTTPREYKPEDNSLRRVEMKVATLNSGGLPQDEAVVTRVVLHELGHALGLFGHNANAFSVMSANFYRDLGSEPMALSLHEADVEVLQQLYRAPLKNNATMVKALPERDISTLERAVREAPTWQNHWQLARAYRAAKRQAEALYHLEAANQKTRASEDLLLAWLQALQQAEQNAKAYAVLMGHPLRAGSTRLGLEQAWLELKLDRRPAARETLEALRLSTPKITNDALYQQIARYL